MTHTKSSPDNRTLQSVVRAPDLEGLKTRINQQLIPTTGGAYWTDDIGDDHFTVDARHSFYIRTDGRTRRVERPYYRVLKVHVKNIGGEYLAVVPSNKELLHAYDAAHKGRDQLAYETIVRAFAPQVASIEKKMLSKFVKLYTMYLSRHKPLPEEPPEVGPGYVPYLRGIGVVSGDAKHGYKLSAKANKFIDYYQDLLEKMGNSGDAIKRTNPYLFVGLCLEKPDVLAKTLDLRSPKTYFLMLKEMFQYQYGAVAEKGKPSDFPVDYDILHSRYVRQHVGLKEDDFTARMTSLVEHGIVREVANSTYSLDDKWYEFVRGKYDSTVQSKLLAA